MYKFSDDTKDRKVNIDDILDGLSYYCEYNNQRKVVDFKERKSTRNTTTQDVYRDTEGEDKNGGYTITINLPNITQNVTIGSSSKRRRDYDKHDELVDKAWARFYAANS